MATYIFKGSVHHNKVKYIKGQACPAEHQSAMLAQGLIEPLPEPVKPVEPPKAKYEPKSKE